MLTHYYSCGVHYLKDVEVFTKIVTNNKEGLGGECKEIHIDVEFSFFLNKAKKPMPMFCQGSDDTSRLSKGSTVPLGLVCYRVLHLLV